MQQYYMKKKSGERPDYPMRITFDSFHALYVNHNDFRDNGSNMRNCKNWEGVDHFHKLNDKNHKRNDDKRYYKNDRIDKSDYDKGYTKSSYKSHSEDREK